MAVSDDVGRRPLGFSVVLGAPPGVSPDTDRWRIGIERLQRAGATLPIDREPDYPLAVNVVFLVPGPTWRSDLTGVKFDKYFRVQNVAQVRAAIDPAVAGPVVPALVELTDRAIGAAEGWAWRRRRLRKGDPLLHARARLELLGRLAEQP